MKSFSFWRGWLVTVGSILTLFGLALVFFNQSPLFDAVFNNHINPSFWPSGAISPDIVRFQAWIYGVLGATVAGWGAVVVFIARYPFHRRESWARDSIAVGISLWYLADTAVSLYFGVGFNAAFNTIVLILVWVPLALTWKAFRSA